MRRIHNYSELDKFPPKKQKIKVGPIELDAWVYKDLDSNVLAISAENLGARSNGSEDWPKISDLAQIFPSDLPDRLWLHISNPHLCFSAVERVYVEATTHHKRATLSASFYFDQWHLNCNLIHFASKVAIELQAMHCELDVVETEIGKNEYAGMFVDAQFELPTGASLESSIQLAAKAMQSAYKSAIRSQVQSEAAPVLSEPEGLSATRWWTKNFVVPVIGSGAVSGIVGWLIGRAS